MNTTKINTINRKSSILALPVSQPSSISDPTTNRQTEGLDSKPATTPISRDTHLQSRLAFKEEQGGPC
eukprot:1157644-Pelagomonas_calceolata.AAC.1